MKRGSVFLAVLVFGALLFSQTPFPTQTPLVPGFAIRPYTPHVGDVVKFTDFSKGNITSWLWEFGDGATSTDRYATHTWTETGDFTVTLTISDGTATASISINAWGD